MRLNGYIYTFFIALFIFTTNVFAIQNYSQQLQKIPNDETLAQSYVVKSIQDDIGFIWFATTQGLNRYDGYHVKPFNGGEFGLDKHNILGLFKTHEAKLIVSTELAGAYLIDPSTLKTEKIYTGQLSNTHTFSPLSSLAEVENEYYLAIDSHIFVFDKTHKTRKPLTSLLNKTDYIRALYIHNAQLYIGANSGLYVYNFNNNKLSSIPLHNPTDITRDNINVKFLTLDPALGLLVGTVEGMYRISFKNNKQLNTDNITTLIANYNIWDYKKTQHGEFIATESGLYQYDRKTNTLEFILNFAQSPFNLTENTINDLMLDRSGLMWLASREHGVFTWSVQTKKFQRVSLATNNIINIIHEDQNAILWLGTNSGIARFDTKNNTSTAYLQSTDPKAAYGEYLVYDIFSAPSRGSQYLWLAKGTGLVLFNTQTKTLVNDSHIKKHTLNNTNTFGMAEIAPEIFAYIKADNFYIFNAITGTNEVIKGLKEQLSPQFAYAFHKPSPLYPNELLLSTSNAFYKYNQETAQLVTIFKSKKARNNVYHTVENHYYDAKRNLLWLATTQEGLIAIDPHSYEKKHTFDTNNGFNTHTIHALLPDDNDFLWISTNNGLYQLNLNTFNITPYTVKDGLNNNKFSAIAATALANGKLAFGSYSGALIFDPTEFIINKNTALNNALTITDLSLFSQTLNYHPQQYNHTPLMLNHDDLGLTVYFSNFDYQNINKTSYNVSLIGPTTLSYNELKANNVFFSKLQPGTYSLVVSATLNGAITTHNSTKLNFTVAYAPWQSPLAYTGYVFIITLVLFIIFWQYRTRKVAIEHAHRKAINSEKQTKLALRNNKSGIWNYDFADNSVNTTRAIELGYENMPERVDLSRIFAIIHPDEQRKIIKKWEAFIQQNMQTHWQAVYRLRHKNGQWLWFQDIGQIIYKPNSNEPQYVTGIFTNITEQLINEQHAKILGEAFSQINDFLVILDDQLKPFSANASFIKTFSNSGKHNTITSKLFIKAMGKVKCKEIAAILKTLKPKENWRTDTQVNTATNNTHPIRISATAVADEHNIVNYYVIVITDLTEQKRAEDELRYLANYDALTHLPNRTLMYQHIENAINTAHNSNTSCAILFIDLDKFKPVNDSFGHAIGDKLLCNITQRITKYLGKNTVLGRQSGDEFLVLIENPRSMTSLETTLTALSKELASKVVIEDFSINISASIGVALYPFDATSTDALIRNADIAMMHAKQAGRNDFRFFSEKMNEQIKQQLILENDLKDATKDDLFYNYYQPIVDIKNKNVNGVELLMRWKNKHQHISPGTFIAIAEETGLIELLTERALQRALHELAPLLKNNALFYISLNISPKHILKDNIAQRLTAILDQANIKAQQLRLEITENTLLEDKDKAAKQLQKLQAAGFKLLLDDFGTGYSSLTYLSQFPINVIKIDQSFVNSIGVDKSDESIIKTIFSLAENLNLYCIAEGVETHEQLTFLANMGCYKIQGYYFAKPMSASKLTAPNCFNTILNLIPTLD